LYNGKEFNEDLGLNWYAYGFRYYDPTIGRFTGVDPIADQFPWVSVYNYAENEPVGGIDLHGLQYVNFNESFYSISIGQTWAHTNRFQSGWDANGIYYQGKSVPIQQFKNEGPSRLPLYRGRFAQSLQWQGENLGRMYETGSAFSYIAYSSSAIKAAGFGKAGLAFIVIDLAVDAYKGIKGYSDSNEADIQLAAIQQAWTDVAEAFNSGMIAPEFHNVQDLSSIANFVYQGDDTFGENEDLRTTAINISKFISGNYKGDDVIILPDSGLDNYKPEPILASPLIIEEQ